MQRVILAAILAVFFVGGISAQPKVVECADGTRWTVSPFNPDPCANRTEELAKPDYPGDFLLAYGLPPEPTQNSLADRIARVRYEQDYKNFRGLMDPTPNFPGGFYAQWGLGEPVFIRTVYGEYVRWPDAQNLAWQADRKSASDGAGVIVATWQARQIIKGFCQFDLHGFIGDSLRERNRKNCGEE